MTDPSPLASADAERITASTTRALVVGPYATTRRRPTDDGIARGDRAPAARIEEAAGLARAIDLDVVAATVVSLSDIRPATYLGPGKVEELAATIAADAVSLVIMDCSLSPVQQRNLERAFKCKIIDRTGLILEIFGRRARTREGALQVELAHLEYQKSRLVRSWTHLERQRGGFGFLGGPGETQIETDRRLIQERIGRIERDLAGVRRTRAQNRKRRGAVPYPVVALVGYTNAGKSTLFNQLTRARVLADDMLFATLDPTVRLLELPHRSRVMLSDTVGFISDLPTTLVSAFRATLEEVVSADLILHVRDVSHPDTRAQSDDVGAVLDELGIEADRTTRVVEVWNKVDRLEGEALESTMAALEAQPARARPVPVSALTGQGCPALMARIEAFFAARKRVFDVAVNNADGPGLHWLYEHAEILERVDRDDGVHVRVRLAPDDADRLIGRFPLASPADAALQPGIGRLASG